MRVRTVCGHEVGTCVWWNAKVVGGVEKTRHFDWVKI